MVPEPDPLRFPQLDLLLPPLELDQAGETWYVRDGLRRKWLMLTPEEWVRQHVVHWLLEKTGVPQALISLERKMPGQFKVQHGHRQRYDVLVYDRKGEGLLLVECKAPQEKAGSAAVEQAIRYNQHLPTRYVWVTNGLTHRVFQRQPTGWMVLGGLPDFEEMCR
jgi:hypothetical protein